MFSLSQNPIRLEIDSLSFSATGGKIYIQLDEALYQTDLSNGIFLNSSTINCSFSLLDMTVLLDADKALVIRIKNTSETRIRVKEIHLEFHASCFKSPRQARTHRHLIHPFNFDSRTGVKPVHMATEWAAIDANSNLVGVFSDNETRQALLIGALPPFGSGFTNISTLHSQLHQEGTFGIQVRFDFQQSLEPGETLTTSPIVALGQDRGEELLERYSQLMQSRLNHKCKPAATGWNSWDYYAGSVSREDMNENIQASRRLFGDRLKYIVIDAGWECQWGIWRASWKFPEGIDDFCRHVKKSGYIPGIWTAPLGVNVSTPLYRHHPDWFVGDAKGNVFQSPLGYGTTAHLDITHPEVQAHLRDVFTELRRCGFEYFKCDFTQLALEAEDFHDGRVGRADIIRTAFRIIREAIGEESYLLCCGGPFESVIGIVDSVRITDDIHNYWGHINQNIRTFFSRYWLQNEACNIDPDFLIVRCPQTTEDRQLNRRLPIRPRKHGHHWVDGAEMTLEETKALALAVYLTGGDLFLSDALHKLNEAGIDLLKKVFPPLIRCAKPLNLFDSDGCSVPVVLAQTENETMLGLFNLTDDPQIRTINMEALGQGVSASDFWTGQPIKFDKMLTVSLAPRSAMGIRLVQAKVHTQHVPMQNILDNGASRIIEPVFKSFDSGE